MPTMFQKQIQTMRQIEIITQITYAPRYMQDDLFFLRLLPHKYKISYLKMMSKFFNDRSMKRSLMGLSKQSLVQQLLREATKCFCWQQISSKVLLMKLEKEEKNQKGTNHSASLKKSSQKFSTLKELIRRFCENSVLMNNEIQKKNATLILVY